MNDKKIALTVGHTYKRGGAVGNSGISEWEFNNQLTLDIFMKLNNPHSYRIFYRKDTTYINAMNILHKEIDEWGADIDLEFHFNASVNKKAKGSEVLYRSHKGKEVARIIQSNIVKHTGAKDRGIKERRDGRGSYGLKIGKSVSNIIEPFFAVEQSQYSYGSVKYNSLVDSIVCAIEELQNQISTKKTTPLCQKNKTVTICKNKGD